MTFEQIISKELQLQAKYVRAIFELLNKGATVPFIARYRKEMTGSADEVVLANVRDRLQQLEELEKRREAILKSIEAQEKLTPALEGKIKAAENLARLEDIYLPYKPKRKTRASIAREKGLEALSDFIFKQHSDDVEAEASKFISIEKGVESIEDALKGARDIIAEKINEDATIRESLRNLFWKEGQLTSKVLNSKKETDQAQKFRDYFEWNESISKAPSHRVLAMRRGEKEMLLSLDISPEEEKAIGIIERKSLRNHNNATKQVELAIADAYKRLLKPSMETETRMLSKSKADTAAINVFSDNVRELLMSAPLGQKNVLALDPGFKSGCKVVCLDKQGKLLHDTIIYPNPPQNQKRESELLLTTLVKKYNIEAIAIGNGTAGRETESLVRSIKFDTKVTVVVVNESGASIYSASESAREEFPNHDLTVRGSVSIGRRLMDPLAELVKLDPKSIGVGQYQHDVDQNLLKKSLDDVVSSCVNKVGVEVNTASKELLSYVSGVGDVIAKNIVNYRNENGAFSSRTELKKVPRLGDKVFEQAAGFLRISGAKNPLDNSSVHPERYALVNSMASDMGIGIENLVSDSEKRKAINLKQYVSDKVGLPTLNDIIAELEKPGRDPRAAFEEFSFEEGVNKIGDLKIGMKLPGIVTNVTKFGAFVDVGVHQDGLVHISQLANRFVSDPSEIVKVNQKVEVTVTEVDVSRKRIALSMKGEMPQRKQVKTLKKKPQPSFDKKKKPQSMDDALSALKGKFGR